VKPYDVEVMVNKALVEFDYLIAWYTIWNSVNIIMYWCCFEKIVLRGGKWQYTGENYT
jgi:hypothetical protein